MPNVRPVSKIRQPVSETPAASGAPGSCVDEMHDDRHWASDVVFGAGIGILSARFVHRREAKLAVKRGMVGLSFSF